MFNEIQILKDAGSKRIYGVILDRPEVRQAMRGVDGDQKDDTTRKLLAEQGDEDDVPGQIVKISISHDGEYATAVCLAADETNRNS